MTSWLPHRSPPVRVVPGAARTRLLAGAARRLAALGRVAPVQFTFRADYPAAAITGQAAAEFTGKAAAEAAELWTYVQTIMPETA